MSFRTCIELNITIVLTSKHVNILTDNVTHQHKNDKVRNEIARSFSHRQEKMTVKSVCDVYVHGSSIVFFH